MEEMSNRQAYAEFIDTSDRDALVAWARAICQDISIEEAARFLDTSPTLDAVVRTLTESLPSSVRQAVAKACEEELRRSTTDG